MRKILSIFIVCFLVMSLFVPSLSVSQRGLGVLFVLCLGGGKKW